MVICPKCGNEGVPTAEIKKSNIYYRIVHHTENGRKMCYLGPSKYKIVKTEFANESEKLLAEYTALTKTILKLSENVELALRKPNTLKTEEDRKLAKIAPILKQTIEKVQKDLSKTLLKLRKASE